MEILDEYKIKCYDTFSQYVYSIDEEDKEKKKGEKEKEKDVMEIGEVYKQPYNKVFKFMKFKYTKYTKCNVFDKFRIAMHPHFDISKVDIYKFVYEYQIRKYITIDSSILEKKYKNKTKNKTEETLVHILFFIDYLIDNYRDFLENYHDIHGNNILQCIGYASGNPINNCGALLVLCRLIQRLDIDLNEKNSNNESLFFNIFKWDKKSHRSRSIFNISIFENITNYLLMQMYMLNYNFSGEKIHYNMYEPSIKGQTADILIRSVIPDE